MKEQNKQWLDEVYHKLENAPDFEIDALRMAFLLYAESRAKLFRKQGNNLRKRYKVRYSYQIVEIKYDGSEA